MRSRLLVVALAVAASWWVACSAELNTPADPVRSLRQAGGVTMRLPDLEGGAPNEALGFSVGACRNGEWLGGAPGTSKVKNLTRSSNDMGIGRVILCDGVTAPVFYTSRDPNRILRSDFTNSFGFDGGPTAFCRADHNASPDRKSVV